MAKFGASTVGVHEISRLAISKPTKGAIILLLASAVGCGATPGPDKTLAGGVLGAAWGAGAGAVVGNQLDTRGPGALVGAGLGAAGGMMTGAGLDLAEGEELENRRQLDALKVRVAATERNFQNLQDELDSRGRRSDAMSGDGEVVFEEGSQTLSPGAGEKLGRIANRLKADPYLRAVQVHGHADDGGGVGKNDLLSQARAETVAAVLSQNGVPRDRIQIIPHGDALPLTSKAGGAGRSANRRVEVVAVR